MNLLTTFTCILTFTPYIYAFDPISIGSAAVAIGAASFRFIRDNTYCMVKECCTEKEIPADYYRKYYITKCLFEKSAKLLLKVCSKVWKANYLDSIL